ncbi:MAG: sulfotransferase [Roseovarius sp.]|nr:sulfotransferase [Roseovarius sp.]
MKSFRRFLIIGLPRSGTTYLMTLLDAHRDIACSGEQFNPYAIVGVGERDARPGALLARDRAPLLFMERYFEAAAGTGVSRVGFKYMLGHNVRILRRLADHPETDLIYVWRENRLAQIASLIKAAQSKRWAQTRADDHVTERIKAGPHQICHRWHEFATTDMLFAHWLEGLPNRRITLEYRELFAPGFTDRITGFLGVDNDPGMKSPLVKQNPNDVLARFENPAPIRRYFTELGFGHWLEPEL